MTTTPRRHRRSPAGATVAAVAAAFTLAGALSAVPAEAQQGTAPSSTTGAGQSTVGDTGQGNSLPMPANPASQTGRTPMQNQSNSGSAAAGGGADQSATSGTTARKQLPPEPGQSANQQGTGRSVDVQTGGSGPGQQQMPQPQQQTVQGAGQPAGQRAAAPTIELQSSGTKAQQPVTRQSLEPQERTGNGPSGLEKGEPGQETKVTPGGDGGSGGGPATAGGIPIAPQGSGTR